MFPSPFSNDGSWSIVHRHLGGLIVTIRLWAPVTKLSAECMHTPSMTGPVLPHPVLASYNYMTYVINSPTYS